MAKIRRYLYKIFYSLKLIKIFSRLANYLLYLKLHAKIKYIFKLESPISFNKEFKKFEINYKFIWMTGTFLANHCNLVKNKQIYT